MNSDWTVKKLGDIVTFLSGGTPSKSNKNYWNGEIPWISASSMQSTRYHDSDLRVTSLGSINGTRLVPEGTVLLLVRGGALHNKIPVGITTREVTFNQDVKALVPKSEDITPYYLLAWLISSRELLLGKVENTGIGAGKLDTKILQELDVPVPPKAELLRLELFSKIIDDKIILHEDINQTLEQMAQALFKSWFIDFEPVKAKISVLDAGGSQEEATLAAMTAISGKDSDALIVFEREQSEQYAKLKATAELFPSAIQDTGSGDIPAGWHQGPLNNIATFADGKVEVSSLTPETYISTENMLENRSGISTASSLPTVNSVPNFRCGHVLISNIRPYFKKIWLARFKGGRSADVLAFEARDLVTVEYLYNLLYQDTFFNFMMLTSKGVKMPRGDKKAIMGWQCIIPDKKVSYAFSKAVNEYYSFIEINNKLNKTLTQLRDTLLPKLLSGEITLPEIEKAVSEVENV